MSEGDRERAIFAEAVARAWKEVAFKAQLVQDPIKALAGLGYKVPPGLKVTVVEDTTTRRHLAIPEASKLEKFKEALIGRVEKNLPLPDGVSVTLVQNTAHEKFFVLPMPPVDTGELSEDELAMVAGGASGVNATCVGNVGTGATAVTVAAGVVAGEVAVLS